MSGCIKVFETYQKSRITFVQSVADLACRPQHTEFLQNAGVMQLLRPLLLDNVPSIQQSAALALGRLANFSDDLAEAIVSNEILPQLVYSLSEQNRFYKKAASFVLRSVAKHSPELAQAVVDAGSLDALGQCLEEFDPTVKEAAAWALGYIAGHTADLAGAVVDAGTVPLLVLCIQEPELSLKRICVSALSDISKHSPELAQAVVDAGAVSYIAPLICHSDAKLKRQSCACLAQISKHSVDLAEYCVEAEIFPNILSCLQDEDVFVQKNAATCIREIAKHTPELAKLIVNAGGAAALVEYITLSKGNGRLPGIMALGYISAFSETLALAVIVSKGIEPLKDALIHEPEDHIKAAAAWSLGQVGRHTPDHAQAVSEMDCPRRLMAIYLSQDASEDLKTKAKRALKSILKKCTHLESLEPLMREAPPNMLKYILEQFSKVLPSDLKAKKSFVQSGGLQLVQELNETCGGDLQDFIEKINNCYPKEIVDYYSPKYANKLIQMIDESH